MPMVDVNACKTLLLTVLALTLLLSGVAPFPTFPPGKAASFTLYGSIGNNGVPVGWGPTRTTITQPGPTLTVNPGEAVNMTLASADKTSHQFCVENDGNQICDPGEPGYNSPLLGSTPILYKFTAPANPGTYTYFCNIHGYGMNGTFVVKSSHDVAVSAISLSRSFAYSGVISNPIQLNVTAQNVGSNTEFFAVYAKANKTLIGNQTITLNPGQTGIVSFNWNTQALARGTYLLTANATRVNGETNLANNNLYGGMFTSRLKGDVEATPDCRVDIVDLSAVGASFGRTSATAGFNAFADLNNDGAINIVDLVIVATNFGQTC